MRSRNSSFPWVVVSLFMCVPILLYLASRSTVVEHNKDKEPTTSDDHHAVDVKYIEFFSVRPSQLVYLDKKGYRLALDSTDESNYIEAKSGVISKTTEKLETKNNSANDSSPARSTNDSLMNAYDETDAKSDAERDESIDYNMGWDEFPVEPKRIPCDAKRPFKNVVLLKTHRTGSGTLANLLYRYGDLNDLDFALPKQRSYDFYWPLHFNPSFVDKAYLNSTSPNLLINARYSADTMASFMPKDSYYIAMIRKPMSHFESVFYGYQIDTILGMTNTSNPLDEFLTKPRLYLLHYLQQEPRFDININMAKNGQIFDLGLQHKYYNDPVMIKKHIDDLAEKIDLVLLMEYYDESLVLLKRELCWDLDDVIYFKLNQRSQEYKQTNITDQQQMQINDWNSADAALYEFFNKTFWNKIANQDHTSFYQEVRELRRKVKSLEEECINSLQTNHDTGEVEIKLNTNTASNINRYLCEKMTMKEENYILYLKKKFNLKLGPHNNHLQYLFYSKVNKTRLEESPIV
ncbi:hypothetical protein OS493_014043 [Desmophyllum pertusum]|uniref:Uncharacterized protein n=1 Tax=Desmophyllum pertusum TaxID=174260 RepID=A0A9X0CXJ2_9CNID|nr:hypothetical protein OS493_014043 [Desmophyllum pertusum]